MRRETQRATIRSPVALFLCFGIATLSYLVLRANLDIVWNDTSDIAVAIFLAPRPLAASLHGLLTHPLAVLVAPFRNVQADGYRPLSAVWNTVAITLVGSGAISQTLWVAFVALLQGATAATVFAVSRRLIAGNWFAFLATALALLTAPAVAAQWVILAGYQNLVILIVCCGLLVYWKWLEAERRRLLYLVILALILFGGPLVREFTGILAVLLLWLEFGVRGRISAVGILALLGLGHALFPTAFFKLFFFPSLPLDSVFGLGTLGQQIAGAPGSHILSIPDYVLGLRWEALGFTLLLVPPSFLVLASGCLFVRWPAISLFGGRLRLSDRLPGVVFAAGLIGLGLWWLFAPGPLQQDLTLLWLVIGVAVAGLLINPILPVWFLASTLPFLRVFTEETHLLYAGVPTAIIACGSIEKLWFAISRLRSARRCFALKLAIVGVAALAVADQSCNLVGSYFVVRSVNRAEHFVSAWLTKATRGHSTLVVNALQGYDLQLFSDDHISVYWTRAAGVPDAARVVDTPSRLQTFLDSQPAKSPIYFLDVDYDFMPNKIAYHSLRYLWGPAVDVEPVGRLYAVSVRYPFLDPIKLLVPREYTSYLGPPDLVDDFYHGPALDGTPFMRELFAVYDLYRVIGRKVFSWVPYGGPPRIVVNGLFQFDIWEWGNGFFGLPEQPRIPSNAALLRNLRPLMCLGRTVDEVRARITAHDCPSQMLHALASPAITTERIGSLHGFEIWRAGDRFIALPSGSGPLDVTGLRRGDYRYRQWFSASSDADIRRLIDAVPNPIPTNWAWLRQPDLLFRQR